MQEQTRKNLAMFEQAMQMWTPFGAAMQMGAKKADDSGKPAAAEPAPGKDELAELKAQLASMQEKIEKLSQSRG
jgi:polyhydroxyalkanoate synthesis regulator protein